MAKKNESGKYRGRVQIGVDKDGKAINKYVCAGTLRELEQKKEYVRNHYIEGQPLREDMPFYQYAEEWYRLKKGTVYFGRESQRISDDVQQTHPSGFRPTPSASDFCKRVAELHQFLC